MVISIPSCTYTYTCIPMHARRCRAIDTRMHMNPSIRACTRVWAADQRRWGRACACACASGHPYTPRGTSAHASRHKLAWNLHVHTYARACTHTYTYTHGDTSSGRAVALRRRARTRTHTHAQARAHTHAGMHATGVRIHPHIRAYADTYVPSDRSVYKEYVYICIYLYKSTSRSIYLYVKIYT